MEQYCKFPLKINNLKRTHRIELLESPISKKRILNGNQTISISDLNSENLGLYTLLPVQSKTDNNLEKYINTLSDLYDNLESHCESKQKFQQYLKDNKHFLSCKLNPLAKIFLETQKPEMDKILESFNFYRKLYKAKDENDFESLKKITKEFFNQQCLELNINK